MTDRAIDHLAAGLTVLVLSVALLLYFLIPSPPQPAAAPATQVSGNITCWASADGAVIRCGDHEYVRR